MMHEDPILSGLPEVTPDAARTQAVRLRCRAELVRRHAARQRSEQRRLVLVRLIDAGAAAILCMYLLAIFSETLLRR